MNESCNNIRQLVSEQRDRPLTTTEQTTLRAHLATCAGCRAFDRDLQAGIAGIARLPRVSGSAEVREAVLAGVHPGGRSSWPRGWRDWTGQLVKIGGAVTACALVAILLMNIFDTSGTGEPDERFSGAGSQPGASEPPICAPGQFELVVETSEHVGDPANNDLGVVAFTVQAVKSTGGAQCRLTMPISLQLTDATGTPLAIEGNPAMGEIDVVLGPDVGSVDFPWINWCGEDAAINVTIEMPTSSDRTSGINEPVNVTPPCVEPNAPSLLGMDAVALWFTPADTDVSTCSGGSTIVTEPEADADGGLRLWFVVMDEGDCEDQGSSVNVRLEEPSGGLLDIEGNNANLILQPHPTGDFEWVGLLWTNWCGETSQVKLEATREGSGMGTFAEETPSCVDASQPSRLTVLDVPPPADPWPADADPDQATPMPGMTSEPPICDPTTLQLALLPMPSTGLSVALSANADGNADAELCSLDASDLTLTITDATGRPIAVEGNGVTFTLGTDDPLLLHSTGSDGLVWDNWCSEPGPFTITATIAGQTLTSEVANGPECTDEDQPSMIWGANNGQDVWKP